MKFLKRTDREIYELIRQEEKRQRQTLMMIPSENTASKAVEEAVGSSLGNKYAEGYPFKRYYQGQEHVDRVEDLARDRAKRMYGVAHVNVQPYSGSPANLSIYLALLSPGDTVMGLSLAFGGHLTHGAPVSITGKFFRSVSYELNEKGLIDYSELRKMVQENKPKLIIAGITAYPRFLDWKKFSSIAKEADAYLMADIAHLSGLVIAGVYPNPAPYVDIITTTTHKTLRGPRGAMVMVTDKGLKKDPDLAAKIDKAVFPGLQGGPHINTIAGIAVALKEASFSSFRKYAARVVENAKVLAEELSRSGFNLISGGTDCHLILLDLRNKGILGNTAAEALERAGIIVNKNSVPFDTNPPFYPSGLRLGTPGITSRGMGKREMKRIAAWINDVVGDLVLLKKRLGISDIEERKLSVRNKLIGSSVRIKEINREIKKLCRHFPIKEQYLS